MRIAVYTEDGRAHRLTELLRASARAAGHVVDVLTPELVGADEAISGVDAPYELQSRVEGFIGAHGVERLVLYDDTTPYGKRLASGLRTRLPVVLVQDRHRDFRFRRRDAAGTGYDGYAATGPATLCVWGPGCLRGVAGPDTSVEVTGAIGLGDDDDLMRAARSAVHRRSAEPGTPLRILIHSTGSSWDTVVAELATYGEVTVQAEAPTSADLAGADLVITDIAPIYPATLLAGRPLVYHASQDVDRVFPYLRHHLIRSTGDIHELAEVALRLKVDGRFRGNPTGEPVEHYLAFHPDVASRIVSAVVAARVPEASGYAVTAPAVDERGLAERALDEIRDRVRRPRSLAIIGTDFGYVTGVAVPVLTYTRDLVAAGPVDVRYVDIWAFSTVEGVLAAVEGCAQVLVNSLALFWRHGLGARVVAALLETRVPTTVYVHETGYVFAREAATRGIRHERLLALLPRLRLLCVSRAQADFYRSLGAVDPVVVYNTVPDDDEPPRASTKVGERPRVVMVGTVQDRKGVDLFSRVAERAAGLPWDFSWIGHQADEVDGMMSPRVEWRGALPRRRVRAELAAADVLFLSSRDDPMPLAVIEAVQQRLRIVTYDRVGSKEVLDGVGGYRGFAEYTPDAAIHALKAVLADQVDEDAYAQVTELFAPARFAERMSTALGLARTYDEGPVNTTPPPTTAPLDELTPAARARRVAELREAGRDADADRYELALERRRS